MSIHFKPDGYSTVSPYLLVKGAARLIEFLKEALDAEELRRFPAPGRGVKHAELRIGDSIVMIADEFPPDWPATPSHVHVYVEDVDSAYERALAAGAEPLMPPAKGDDEDKRGGVKGPGGVCWWIGTRVE